MEKTQRRQPCAARRKPRRSIGQAQAELNADPLDATAPPLAGQVVMRALEAEGIEHQGAFYTAAGFVVTVKVPRGGAIWISNRDATVDYPPEEHDGWLGMYHLTGWDEGDPELERELFSSTSTDCAADSAAAARTIKAWMAQRASRRRSRQERAATSARKRRNFGDDHTQAE